MPKRYHKYGDVFFYCDDEEWKELNSEAQCKVEDEGCTKFDALIELAEDKCIGYNYGIKPSKIIY